ncbi:MAG: ribonuclease III [Parachlamydiales bacterium]|jgi:ribonuclease-3
MFSIDDLKENFYRIQEQLGYRFQDLRLLLLAFVHASYVNEHRDWINEHNERLEFLGDAVLGMLVADFLYREYPESPEGELTLLRAALVGAPACSYLIKKLDVGQYLLLGKGERLAKRGRESILANLFEALIGAIYLDGGLEKAGNFFFGKLKPEISELLKMPPPNFKAALQDYTQKHFFSKPCYRILAETGPGHSKHFTVGVFWGEQELARGEGKSKKEAEQMAAKKALEKQNPLG